MSAHRPTRRVRRVAAAAAVLGAAGLFLAPAAAFADGYNNTAVDNNTSVLGVKYGPGGSSGSGTDSSGASGSSGTQVLGVKYGSSSGSSLAFTGFEAGAVGLLGTALVAGGAALVISGRRRSTGRVTLL